MCETCHQSTHQSSIVAREYKEPFTDTNVYYWSTTLASLVISNMIKKQHVKIVSGLIGICFWYNGVVSNIDKATVEIQTENSKVLIPLSKFMNQNVEIHR